MCLCVCFCSFLGVLSVELYDQIPEVCFFSHRAFPFFFILILCTNEIRDFLDTLVFHLSSITTNVKPTSVMIIACSSSGEIVIVT